MEAKAKLSKEVIAQEARYILDSLLNANQLVREARLEELRRSCEPSLSLRFTDYLGFLERFGYVTYDQQTTVVAITADGERVVAGEKVAELVIDVVHHFRPLLGRGRARDEKLAKAAPVQAAAAPWRGAAQRPAVEGRFEKLEVIGSGGIGTVYLARQISLDRKVALKEIRELFGFFTEQQREEILRRFEAEALKASRLFHPNIAPILDADTGREFPYLVSELLGGGNLRQILTRAESIPPDIAVQIFLQVLFALGHAHQLAVVHRGLKPENILFDASGRVRVTDFGLARIVERDQAVIQQVYVGMGSVAYMAPEFFAEGAKVGPHSDLYALGIILYEMLARKLPGRRSPMPSELHPGLPKAIDDLFDKLTQDDPQQRYSQVEEVLADFYGAAEAAQLCQGEGLPFFLQNPLQRLTLQEESGAAEEQAPEAPQLETTRGVALPDVEPADAVSAEDEGSAPEAPVAPESGSEQTSESAECEVLAPEEAVDSGDDGEDSPRRNRVQRPYSFQQRRKERP